MNDYQVAHNRNHYIKSELSIKAKNLCEQFKAFDFRNHLIIIIEKDLFDLWSRQWPICKIWNWKHRFTWVNHRNTIQKKLAGLCHGRRKIWTFKLLCSHVGKVSLNLLRQGRLLKKLQLIAKAARLLKFLLLIKFKDKSTSSSITQQSSTKSCTLNHWKIPCPLLWGSLKINRF